MAPSQQQQQQTAGEMVSHAAPTTAIAAGHDVANAPVLQIDIDQMDEKPWRRPGVAVADYFNYGFNEDSWRAYCQRQVQLRLENEMRGKISVYRRAPIVQQQQQPPSRNRDDYDREPTGRNRNDNRDARHDAIRTTDYRDRDRERDRDRDRERDYRDDREPKRARY